MRLVADDLTGALDSAARFTSALGPISVHFGPTVPQVTGHAALDLACRDGSMEAAAAASRDAAGFFDDGLAFKKIDSLLRGHWAAELAALLATRRYRHCILAPAFPDQGRVTVAGRQHLVAGDGSLQALPIDPKEALAAQGLVLTRVDASMPPAAGAAPAIQILDARSTEDLAAAVRYGRSLAGPVLWCGTAGLAGALAGAPAKIVKQVAAPALALIGSNHPVMREQIEAACRSAACGVSALGEDPLANLRTIEAGLARHRFSVASFALPAGLPPAVAAGQIEQRLCALVPHLPKPATLIAAGGETLRAICRASSASHLLVIGENRPGIPYSRIVGGAWDGVAVVSKSGAFGKPSFFDDLVG